jgi:hypothetical protein
VIWEGERKQVTVLFADLKGSTELIRDLDSEAAQRPLDPALHVASQPAIQEAGMPQTAPSAATPSHKTGTTSQRSMTPAACRSAGLAATWGCS